MLVLNATSTHFDAAIIDLDGTMVDTMGDFVAASSAMLAGWGLPSVSRDVVERGVGKGSEHLIRYILDESNRARAGVLHACGATDSEANKDMTALHPDDALALYLTSYRGINGQHSHVYPGVVAGLQSLQRLGIKLACLTNKPLAFAQELLKLKGLDGFFSHVYGGDSFARKKPDPLPLLSTCAALGTLPARTLMIGDSSNDAQAARAAGCPVLLVTYGYNHGAPVRAVDADGFLDSLADLPALLQPVKSP